MIVTRSWLEEFIDLEGITDEKLYEIFNAIGLEVDGMTVYEMPENVVVGRVVSCQKHPDADKLNLCRVDVGGEELQIVCGAANVRQAEYVAVAKVGAVLPGDFVIRPAKLRGVESLGMICSSSELGLPETERGIWILDASLGDLEVGKALRTLTPANDTVFELELTANRGDCLSVHGVARDLGAALDRPVHPPQRGKTPHLHQGIGKIVDLHVAGAVQADMYVGYLECEAIPDPALVRLRLAMVGESASDALARLVKYTTHATGVICHGYDAEKADRKDGKVLLELSEPSAGCVVLDNVRQRVETVGVRTERLMADAGSRKLIFVAEYIDPERVVEGVSAQKCESDPEIYYRSSRGSEPMLHYAWDYLNTVLSKFGAGACAATDEGISLELSRQPRTLTADAEEISAIIGQEISRKTVHRILTRLGFEIHETENSSRFGVSVPPHRHDIANIQDLAEEVLRIVGINSIQAKPLVCTEENRLSEEARRYRGRRDLRERAVAAGFYEALSYVFSDRRKLERFGFPVLSTEVDLLNPIVEELNTLRSTLLINLLDAVARNTSYGKRKIPLFEIGMTFDSHRAETERMAFVWCGESEEPAIPNHGKPAPVTLPEFVRRITEVTGKLSLESCEPIHGLMHPYQSARIFKGQEEIGYLFRLHPEAAEFFGVSSDCYLAECLFEPLLPKLLTAEPISNYQPVSKDLSIVIDRDLAYVEIRRSIAQLKDPLLRRFFPIDLYEDESLGKRKSLTLRFILQSEEKTLSDEEIDASMRRILQRLEDRCGAVLR